MSDDLWALRQLAEAKRLQDWMFSVIRPAAPGPMLEIGPGLGTFSSMLLAAGADPLLLVEPERELVDVLERELGDDPRVVIACESLPDSPTLTAQAGTFTYALAQNVLEHIPDDAQALRAVGRGLAPGGEAVLLVPAHPALFGRLDRRFGHERRYTRARLRSLVDAAGLEFVSLRSFNLLGALGWAVASRSRVLDITTGSMRAYETLVRAWRPIEDALRPPVGLSLVARARKPR